MRCHSKKYRAFHREQCFGRNRSRLAKRWLSRKEGATDFVAPSASIRLAYKMDALFERSHADAGYGSGQIAHHVRSHAKLGRIYFLAVENDLGIPRGWQCCIERCF